MWDYFVVDFGRWKVKWLTLLSLLSCNFEQLSSGSSGNKPRGGGVGKSLNMNMKFSCAQCWRDGLISEPDKALKYCSAKARHTWVKIRYLRSSSTNLENVFENVFIKLQKLYINIAMSYCWRFSSLVPPHIWAWQLCHLSSSCVVIFRWTKERWVLLVKSLERSKWVQVRPLPHAKNFPVHYDVGVPPLLLCTLLQQVVWSERSDSSQTFWHFLSFMFTMFCISGALKVNFLSLLVLIMVSLESLYCTLWSVLTAWSFLLADMYPDFGEKEM